MRPKSSRWAPALCRRLCHGSNSSETMDPVWDYVCQMMFPRSRMNNQSHLLPHLGELRYLLPWPPEEPQTYERRMYPPAWQLERFVAERPPGCAWGSWPEYDIKGDKTNMVGLSSSPCPSSNLARIFSRHFWFILVIVDVDPTWNETTLVFCTSQAPTCQRISFSYSVCDGAIG